MKSGYSLKTDFLNLFSVLLFRIKSTTRFQNKNAIAEGLGPQLVLSGKEKKTTDFSRYFSMTGVHQFCGKSDVPFDYFTSYSNLIVKFASSDSARNRGKGFKLEYQLTGCNRNYTTLQGRIVTYVDTECHQTITVPKNYTISIFFQNMALFNNDFTARKQACDNVGLEVLDIGGTSSTVLGRICGYAIPNPIFSLTNKIIINVWNKDKRQMPAHFDLVYTSSDKGRGCGGTIYNHRGSFSSPLFPMGYKYSSPCVWNLRVPIGMRIALKFDVFDIHGNCDINYVQVTTFETDNGSEHKFCQNDTPAILYSNSHALIKYQSSALNGGTGFSATFEAIS